MQWRTWLAMALILCVMGCKGSDKKKSSRERTVEAVSINPTQELIQPTVTRDPGKEYIYIKTEGIPAISTDGQWFAYSQIDEAGGSGLQTHYLVLEHVSGSEPPVVQLLFDGEEAEIAMTDGTDTLNSRVSQRIAAANRNLATRQWRSLIPMKGVDLEEADKDPRCADFMMDNGAFCALTGQMEGKPLRFYYVEPQLTVTLDGKVVQQRKKSGWVFPVDPPKTPSEDDEEMDMECSNPGGFQSGYIDPQTKRALVEIAFEGTDMCWEPADEVQLFNFGQNAPNQPPEATHQVHGTFRDADAPWLTLREKSRYKSRDLAHLPDRTLLRKIRDRGKWTQVRVVAGPHSGREGFVATKWLRYMH